MDRSDISRRLLEVCREQGVIQADLVRSSGATSPTVSDWFNKGAVPDAATLVRVARVLHINLHWLLTGQGPKLPPGQGDAKSDRLFASGVTAVLTDVRAMMRELEARWAESPTPRAVQAARAGALVRQQAEAAQRTPGRRKRPRRRAG